MPVTRRPTARVLLLDPSDRVLLFLAHGDSTPWIWITPGGGVEPGETLEDAARRELYEETAQKDVSMGPVVWYREHTWGPPARRVRSEEHFFLARTTSTAVEVLDQTESLELKAWRWWSLPALRADPSAVCAPRRIRTLLAPLLAGDLPESPLDVGI